MIPEEGILNDDTGTLVAVVNADTSAGTINNGKVAGLVNLGANAFSAYPLVLGTDTDTTIEVDNIQTTPTDALLLTNTTAATGTIREQYTPNLHWHGTGYDTALRSVDFIAYASVNATSRSNTHAAWTLASSIDGAAYSSLLTVDTDGNTNFYGTGGFQLAGILGVTGDVTFSSGLTVYGSATFAQISSQAVTGNMGVGGIVGAAEATELTTVTQTSIVDVSAPTTGLYRIDVYFTVITAATNVTVTVSWEDPTSSATLSVNPWTTSSGSLVQVSGGSFATGSYPCLTIFAYVSSASALQVQATAGTANQVYVSTTIERLD